MDSSSLLRVPERFLRDVWQHQLFTLDDLRTIDGQPVVILSPVKANNDGGPDFREARIRIDHITYRGDVELHRDAASWREHSHHLDPHYNKVILHVAMTANPLLPPACTASRRALPLLVLQPYIDPAVRLAWERMLPRPDGPRLPCATLSDEIPVKHVRRCLARLASERLEMKIRRFQERLQQLAEECPFALREPYPRYYGDPTQIPSPSREYTQRDFAVRRIWEQLLYEGIMECLGYAKNRKPFTTLARSMTLERLQRYALDDTVTMMGLLFGAGGLLPSSRGLPEKESRAYVRILRRRWKALRPCHRIPVLHEADWLFFRLRPGNFPTARLAAFCYVLPRIFGGEGFRSIIALFTGEALSSATMRKEFHKMFDVVPDTFWQRHYHFRGFAGQWGARLGSERINDILTNAVIPIALLYARIFRNASVQSAAKHLLETMPLSPPNSVTMLLQRDLFRGRPLLQTVSLQQGALQLFGSYCRPHRCNICVLRMSPRESAECRCSSRYP
jgi:hypothetical protein